MGPGPLYTGQVAALLTGLGVLLGVALAPLLRAGVVVHVLAMALVWYGLERWARLDSPIAVMGEIARPVGGALFVLLGMALARVRSGLPWAVAGVLLIAGLAAPRVYLRATTPPLPPRAELPPAPPGAPNVVLVVLDTVRAGNVSGYGYSRPTSPEIDRLAAEGALFLDATSPSTWSLPSHASLFTGPLPVEPRRPRRAPLSRRALSDAGAGARAQGLRDLLHHGQPLDQRRPRADAGIRLAGSLAARAGRRRAGLQLRASPAGPRRPAPERRQGRGRGRRQLRGLDARPARGRRSPGLRVPELHRGALPLSPAPARRALPVHGSLVRRSAPDQHRPDRSAVRRQGAPRRGGERSREGHVRRRHRLLEPAARARGGGAARARPARPDRAGRAGGSRRDPRRAGRLLRARPDALSGVDRRAAAGALSAAHPGGRAGVAAGLHAGRLRDNPRSSRDRGAADPAGRLAGAAGEGRVSRRRRARSLRAARLARAQTLGRLRAIRRCTTTGATACCAREASS